ncbi:hypothetical protein L873DRAFT_1812502 [Choiromyces venosus 120613-1]|uniref:Transposase IS30-like HTH domain-containing protein n=1 Tax=Choiromyces venosus 120613-1 TaxID=1336337 RepID=A0A3N4JBT9_9PEZI|nr:hypothetical protein L873DRAFT_1812502 [Choiromyces venosus 120613-1]
MPWDQATRKRCETTINEKVRIIELRTTGMSFRQIGAETAISRTQVAEIYRRWTLAILLIRP